MCRGGKVRGMDTEEARKAVSEKERAFVHAYLKCKSQKQAAIMVGYSEKSAESQASRLMRKPSVRAYRDCLLREDFESIGITRHSVATEVWEVYQRCMVKKPVLEWDSEKRDWIESGTWQFNATGALKALTLMTEMLGKLEGDEEDEDEENEESVEEVLSRLGESET